MSANLKSNVDGFIYLKTSPEVCLERIKKRGRSEEKGFILFLFVIEIIDL